MVNSKKTQKSSKEKTSNISSKNYSSSNPSSSFKNDAFKVLSSQKNQVKDIGSSIKILRYILIFICFLVSFVIDKLLLNLISVIQYPVLFNLFYAITLLGEIYVYALIVLIVSAALIINKKNLSVFILAIGVSGAMQAALKLLINRPRPFQYLNISSPIYTQLSSFPSGHTMMFFAMVPIISKDFPKLKIFIWTIAILVGISRIYLRVHYLSDVLAGAILGYMIGALFIKIGEKYDWKY